ncbi:hypothetical protein EUX98_g2731 [Antrodiella citrinella]|uniref:RNB domain-containing protein n=1 Tax=Antrodiella citrinella TaxID=2447956 RepID=A0A4S4MZJ6_9APHY|nr:hypothetical protein EUX98_g2731 [Antrodiella citrinella]
MQGNASHNKGTSRAGRKKVSPQAASGSSFELGSFKENTITLRSNPQSMEKELFEASLELDDVDTRSYVDIPLGSFLEIRRSPIPISGIYLGKTEETQGYNILSMLGELWTFKPSDIHFVIPNIVDPRLASQCNFVDRFTSTEAQVKARIQVLQAIRPLLVETEAEYVRISSRITMAYETLRSKAADEWSKTTTTDVARLLVQDRSQHIPRTTLFAVHQHLMERHEEFVADATDFLATQRFRIRPKQDVADIQDMQRMVTTDDARLASFVRKAKQLLSVIPKDIASSWDQPPSLLPYPDVSFTPDDLPIIRFLRAGALARRFTQRNPYIILSCMILRKVRDYQADIHEAEVAEFLTRLGLMASWDDATTSGMDNALEPDSGGTGNSMGPTAQSSSSRLRDLGPQDFYPDDIAASVRHDFGHLPVYVIDDAGAQELDDGISIERDPLNPESIWVHVHVADPTSMLPPTHDVSKSAHRLGQTHYLPYVTYPMLPQGSGLQDFSLGSHTRLGLPERVMTFSYLVDEQGGIAKYKIRAGLVRNVQLLRYDDVDAALGIPKMEPTYPFGHAPPPHPRSPLTQEQIQDMKDIQPIVKRLTAGRLRTGALGPSFRATEISVVPQPLPAHPLGIRPHTSIGFPQITYGVANFEYGTRQVVAECMKTASRVMSLYMRDNGIPAIRRAMPPLLFPSEEALADVMAMRNEYGTIDDIAMFIRKGIQFAPASFTTAIAGHGQLGIPDDEGYIQSTSPLRRFLDLVAHWQLKHHLISPTSQPLFGEEWMKACATEMTNKFQVSKRMHGLSRVFWALKVIERWIDHPETHADMEDPLQNLVAIPNSPARLQLDGSSSSLCSVPLLGLRATLQFPRHTVHLGVPVPVKILSLRFGAVPRLLVTPK